MAHSIDDTLTSIGEKLGTLPCNVQSYVEYLTRRIQEYQAFTAGEGAAAVVPVTSAQIPVPIAVAQVTQEQYQQVLESDGDEEVTLATDDSGGSITLTANEVFESFADQVESMRVQREFLTYCATTDTVNSSDFASRLTAVMPDTSQAVVSKYIGILDSSGSVNDAIVQFFTMEKDSDIVQQDNYITLTNYSLYSGSIATTAWSIVTDRVSSFFSDIFDRAQKFWDCFKLLGESLAKLARWGISLLFKDVTTVYQKASGCSFGIMDLPLMQVTFTKTQLEQLISNVLDRKMNDSPSLADRLFSLEYGLTLPQLDSYQRGYLADALYNLTRVQDADGSEYAGVTEVVVPTATGWPIVMRVGQYAAGQCCLSIFVQVTAGDISDMDDVAIKKKILTSLTEWVFFGPFSLLPCIPESMAAIFEDGTAQGSSSLGVFINDLFMLNGSYEDDDVSLVGALSYKQHDILYSWRIYGGFSLSMLLYMAVFGPGFRYHTIFDSDGLWHDHTPQWMGILFGNDATSAVPDCDYYQKADYSPIQNTSIMDSVFHPYTTSNPLPISLHYQSTEEQAIEWIRLAVKIVVAAVVIVATVKFIKWRSRRKIQTRLVTETTSAKAWDYAARPTQENYTAFRKAYKKEKRTLLLNTLLGLGSTAAATSAADPFTTLLKSSSEQFNATDGRTELIIRLISPDRVSDSI